MATIEFHCRHRYASGFELNAEFESNTLVTALVGPSGSGKSTVLSMIAGLLQPQHGTIRFGDRVFNDTRSEAFLPPEKRNVGFLFQDLNLFPHLTVRRNLNYGSHGKNGRIRVSLEQTLDALELGDTLHRYPRSLSGGQQQRVALARALLSSPQLLLLDEPLTAVESRLRDQVVAFTESVIRQYQMPAIIVTHSRDVLDQLTAKIVEIRDGKIVGE